MTRVRRLFPLVSATLLLLLVPQSGGEDAHLDSGSRVNRTAVLDSPLHTVCRQAKVTVAKLAAAGPVQSLPAVLDLERKLLDALRASRDHDRALVLRQKERDVSLAIVHTQRALTSLATANKTQAMMAIGTAVREGRQATLEARRLTAELCGKHA